MPNGFVGRPALRYITDVVETLATAELALQRDPFRNLRNRAVPPPSVPPQTGKQSPYTVGDAKIGGFSTGVGASENIVVEDSEYISITQQIDAVDDLFGETMYQIASEIEALCSTSFILPRTVPKCLLIAQTMKGSLGEFRSVTEEGIIQTKNYSSDIVSVG